MFDFHEFILRGRRLETEIGKYHFNAEKEVESNLHTFMNGSIPLVIINILRLSII